MSGFKMYTFYAPLLLEYKIYRDNPGRYPDGSLDNDEGDPRIQKGRILMGDKRVTVRERSIEDAMKKSQGGYKQSSCTANRIGHRSYCRAR